MPYAWAAGLALLVGGPWLLPGYIFGTDWPGPRHLLFPDQVWSGAGWQLALAVVSAVLGAAVTTKLLILGSLFVAALSAYKALPIGGFIARAAAATIYTLNPFVYGRIHYGQLVLVAAYAVLPILAMALRELVRKPGLLGALLTALTLTVIGMLDVHVLIPAATLTVAVGVAFAIARVRDLSYLLRLSSYAAVAAGLTLLASAYWLIPLARGTNQQGQFLSGFGAIDLGVFRTVPDARLGLIPNVLGLYGFWAENVSRFPSMKDFAPLWPLVLVSLLALAGVGVVANLWHPDEAFSDARPWILALLVAGGIAAVLDLGFAEPHIRPLIQWLDATVPPYRGMRDAGKWAALIALAYAQLVPLGAVAIVGWLRRDHRLRAVEVVPIIVGTLLVALPIYYGNGLLFGMHGEIQPSAYPAGWYAADRLLLADREPGTTLFLPWHLYLKFGFIKNTNAVIATPAPSFFAVPVLVSADPEIPGMRPPNTPEQALLSRLVAARGGADWPQALSTINVKYVLLAREVDWRDYQFLDQQAGLMKVGDYGSIALYENLAWHAP